jgi:putative ABC transport system substrate-binding protein
MILDFEFSIERSKSWKTLSLALGAIILALCSFADAQQPTKVARLGFLIATSPSTEKNRIDSFLQGMRELGYAEGKNLVIEWKYAEGKFDRLTDLASELTRLKVQIIVTTGSTSTRAAKEATSTIPIVMTQDTDPVRNGFITSLSRPGKNITGLSNLYPELSGKQLELLKEVVPRLLRVAALGTSTSPQHAQVLKETELAAGAFGVKLQHIDVLRPQDIEMAFRSASKGQADAVLVLASPVFVLQRKELADFAVKSRLPAIYERREFVDDGGLMTYGPSSSDLFRRAAGHVDKILKGANPAELPVEQPVKFELIINLKAATQIALRIPPNVLARADHVIK